MQRGNCRVCGKPLKDEPAALIMDRAGNRYHFSCWSNLMDVRIQENRDALARRRQKIEKGRKKRGKGSGEEPHTPPSQRP
jgi:YHS domain-containing protein